VIAKTIEIRDDGTMIPALAVKLTPACEADRYLLARAGYGVTPERQGKYVLLIRITGGSGQSECDSSEWGDGAGTMSVAHQWLIDHFDEIGSGAVVDVEYILGETAAPKRSGAEAWPA